MSRDDAATPESVLAAEIDWSDMARARAGALATWALDAAARAEQVRVESRGLVGNSQAARAERTQRRLAPAPALQPAPSLRPDRRLRAPVGEPPPELQADGLTPAASFALTDLSVDEIWIKYAELGGDRGPAAVGEYFAGGAEWPAMEVNILAHVLNEHFLDNGLPPLAGYHWS